MSPYCLGQYRWSPTACLTLAIIIVFLSVQAGAAEVIPGAIRLESEANVSAVPGDVVDPLDSQDKKSTPDANPSGEFVIAPIPSRSPLLGWTFAVPAMYIYKPQSASERDSPWTTGAAGFYAENESWGGGIFHKMSLRDDKWRILGSVFYADLSYDFFGIGTEGKVSVPLRQEVSMVLGEALYEVYDHLYLGARGIYANTDVALDIPGDILPPPITPDDLVANFNLSTIAPKLQYDTRDNQFNPREGWLVEGQIVLGREAIGSDSDYEKYEFQANRYMNLAENRVLAIRTAAQYIGGDAPFFLYPAFGSGADLRGYETGAFRDRFLFAVQAEYRWRFAPRMGAVAFAGVGTVNSEFGRWGSTLGSIGAGFRYVLAPKNDMTLRIDVATGRGNTEFYVGIGEAF